METETVRIPKWFLQAFAGLLTTGMVGAFGWCVWVSITLDRWTHIMENIPQRLAIVESVQQVHSQEIRKLKRVKIVKPEANGK